MYMIGIKPKFHKEIRKETHMYTECDIEWADGSELGGVIIKIYTRYSSNSTSTTPRIKSI